MSQTYFEDNLNRYCVVEFPEEAGDASTPVTVVPASWIKKEGSKLFCGWPAFKSDFHRNKAVRERKSLDSFDSWEKCPIHIKYTTRSFDKANEKLKSIYESLDDIIPTSFSSGLSEDEQHGAKRKKRTSCRLESFVPDLTSSDDEDQLPEVQSPKIIKDKALKKKESAKTHRQGQVKEATQDQYKTLQFNDTLKLNDYEENKQVQVDYREQDNTLTGETIEEEPIVTFMELHKTCKNTQKLVAKVLTKVELLSTEMKYMMQLVTRAGISTEIDVHVLDDLPKKTIEELRDFNLQLDTDNFFQDMVSGLISLGGKDIQDSTRRIMGKIMSHDLALKCNWSGQGKEAFKTNLNIIKLILVCLRKTPNTRNATEQELTATIKSWLRTAPDRAGGRNKRRTTVNEIKE